ncbi:hypothetical protein CYY_004637 [Polysphondylium violaceum]|uniref:Transmembrane protein n=1 Tax=Polysphondylium violaceum TaxID=133409 RepID=A0A8J4V086_9MYCE|nr:hypothetical protein CYY_004637 [Polysphondylium violaceum]
MINLKKYMPAVSGLLFGAAWFLMIDGHVYENHNLAKNPDFGPSIKWVYYLPGVFSTLGLVMSNIVNLDVLTNSSFFADDDSVIKTRIWLFVSFAINFGCIAGAIWIMAGVFLPPHNYNSASQWPGIALTLQNALIFISSLILVYAKTQKEDDGYSNF